LLWWKFLSRGVAACVIALLKGSITPGKLAEKSNFYALLALPEWIEK